MPLLNIFKLMAIDFAPIGLVVIDAYLVRAAAAAKIESLQTAEPESPKEVFISKVPGLPVYSTARNRFV